MLKCSIKRWIAEYQAILLSGQFYDVKIPKLARLGLTYSNFVLSLCVASCRLMEAEKEHVKTEHSKREIEEKLKEEIEAAKVFLSYFVLNCGLVYSRVYRMLCYRALLFFYFRFCSEPLIRRAAE